jgi:hypothetical protein
MKDIIVLFIAILLTAIAMIGMGSADDQEQESAYAGPYELHFYANNHLEFNVEDKSSGGIGRYKITGYSVGDPDGAKFEIGILNDPTKKEISQTRQQQIDKMMGLIADVPGYVVEVDDTVFLDDNHPAQIIRCTLDGTLAHEYIGIMLSGTEEVLMDAPGQMETGLDDYDYAAVLENIQIIGHGIAKFDGENTKPGTLSDATSWSPGMYQDDGIMSGKLRDTTSWSPGMYQDNGSHTAVVPDKVVSRPQKIHLFSNVPFADSSKFKSNTYQEVSIGTTTWDKTPYHLANPYLGTVTVQPGQKCFLAGDSAGQIGWRVDNFLLFEIRNGMEKKRLICGAADPVYYNGERVQQVGSNKFDFNPGEIDLTGYFPQGVPVELKVSALDYGGSGYVSNVYLIIQ